MRKIMRLILCFCLIMVIMGGCGKESDVTSEREDREESIGIEGTDAPALEESAAETVESTEPVIEFVELAAEDFEYSYDESLEGIVITKCHTSAQAIRIPTQIDGETVKAVRILYNDWLTHVELPDSVVACSFQGCGSLTSITIPDGVTGIDELAFSDCSSLTNVIIPDSVTSIGRGAFHLCESLTSITIPDGVTSIGENAFAKCSNLTSITIPEGVTRIEGAAFAGCSSLTSITIPEGVTYIGSSAFTGCSSLTSITIPDSVTDIGLKAFSSCSSLTSIIIPDSVISIGQKVFSGCENLKVTYQGQEYTIENDPDDWWVYF